MRDNDSPGAAERAAATGSGQLDDTKRGNAEGLDSASGSIIAKFRDSAVKSHGSMRVVGRPVDTRLWTGSWLSLIHPKLLARRVRNVWGEVFARSRVPVHLQAELSDCGPACLMMTLKMFGVEADIQALRQETGAGRDGVSARAILAAARRRGIVGRGIRTTVEGLRQLAPGAILFWNFNHFVVLESVTRGSAFIVDPAYGRRKVSLTLLDEAFTGVALEFQPSLESPQHAQMSRKRRLPKHWQYLRYFLPKGRQWFPIILASILLLPFSAILPVATDHVVSEAARGRTIDLVGGLGVALVGMVGTYCLLQISRSLAIVALQAAGDRFATIAIMDRLIRLPYEFFSARSPGDLALRIRTSTALRQTLTSSVFGAGADGVLVLIYVALLLFANVPLAIVVISLAILQVGVLLVAWRQQRYLVADALERQARSQGELEELIEGMLTLKSTGLEGVASERWSHSLADEINSRTRSRRSIAGWGSLSSCLQFAAPIVVLVVGTSWLGPGLPLGKLIGFTSLAMGLFVPLGTLVQSGVQMAGLGASLSRLVDIFESLPQSSTALPAVVNQGAVELEDVSFRYHRWGEPVLDGIDLKVAPGKFVLILGASGSGKSTLAMLLAGLYQPTEGRMLIDGFASYDFDRTSLRESVSFVNQDSQLFAGSIHDNITLGLEGVDNDQVREAALLAEIHDDIKAMPMSYMTILSSRGHGISGGQRQRIALARALVGRPKLLILDEATSAVDPIAESRIFGNLLSLGCTLIVIAHRLTAAEAADKVVVMRNGKVSQSGRYDEVQVCSNENPWPVS